MTNSVDMCGDGSSRHSVGTPGMSAASVHRGVTRGVYREVGRGG